MDLLREINVKTGTVVKEPLEKVVEHLEEEARMILPGIQALFGFQLIAVFNQRFFVFRSVGSDGAFHCTSGERAFGLTDPDSGRVSSPGRNTSNF